MKTSEAKDQMELFQVTIEPFLADEFNIFMGNSRQQTITRMSRLKGPITVPSLVSGILFLATVGIWIYQEYSSF